MARSPHGRGSAGAESRRLIDGEGSAKERRLLRAGIDEAPPSRAGRERTLVALGIVASAGMLTTPTPAAAQVSHGLAAHAKWLIFGVAGAAAAVSGIEMATSRVSAPLVEPSVAPSHRPGTIPRHVIADASVASLAPSLSPPSPVLAQPAVPNEVDSPDEHSTAAAGRPSKAEPRHSSKSEAISVPSELVAQVAALDRARAALRAGRARESVALLDSFDRIYPGSSLAPEATVMRVSALLTLGQRAQATRLVRGYCRLGGRDAYGQRLMTLVGLDEGACEDSERSRDRSK